MADDLLGLSFTVNEESLQTFGDRFKNAKKAEIRKGLTAIRQAWQAEIVRQQVRLQSKWTPLKRTGPKRKNGKGEYWSYYERKQHSYYGGKGRGGKVRFLSVLKRTGEMMEGYVNGITVDTTNLTVNMPYPNIAAKVHQGELNLPKGVLAHRPFEVERFEDIAIDKMDDAITGDV